MVPTGIKQDIFHLSEDARYQCFPQFHPKQFDEKKTIRQTVIKRTDHHFK